MGSPSLIAAQAGKILSAVNQSSKAFYRVCQAFGLAAEGSTGSSASGWVVTLDISHAAGLLQLPSGTAYEVAAAATVTPAGGNWDNSSAAAAMDNYAHIVFDCSGGAAAVTTVWGTAAAHEEASVMTDAQIASSLGTTEFVRLCNILVYNSAITTVSNTYDNTVRSGFGNVSSGFDGDLATTEDSFNDRN